MWDAGYYGWEPSNVQLERASKARARNALQDLKTLLPAGLYAEVQRYVLGKKKRRVQKSPRKRQRKG